MDLTSENLKAFYENLPGLKQDSFRQEVMKNCAWTYSVWRNKLNGRTKINVLESNAINLIIQTKYLTTKPVLS
jgi:hypothetical protein